MSEELRPCPFCGGEAITTAFFDADDFDYMPIEVKDCDAEVTCKNERCINGWWLSPKDWNTRPIEDVLIAERDQAREMVDWLIAIGDLLLNQDGASEKVLLAEDEWRKLVDAWKAEK